MNTDGFHTLSYMCTLVYTGGYTVHKSNNCLFNMYQETCACIRSGINKGRLVVLP